MNCEIYRFLAILFLIILGVGGVVSIIFFIIYVKENIGKLYSISEYNRDQWRHIINRIEKIEKNLK